MTSVERNGLSLVSMMKREGYYPKFVFLQVDHKILMYRCISREIQQLILAGVLFAVGVDILGCGFNLALAIVSERDDHVRWHGGVPHLLHAGTPLVSHKA